MKVSTVFCIKVPEIRRINNSSKCEIQIVRELCRKTNFIRKIYRRCLEILTGIIYNIDVSMYRQEIMQISTKITGGHNNDR